MTPNESTTLMSYLSNVTWITTDDNETSHYESSLLPQQQQAKYVTQNSFFISTTATTIAVRHVQTTTTTTVTTSWIDWLSSGRLQIPLYATILLLAIVGNSLVIMTLVQNRRMRTITNVFLLNLAVSDILLGKNHNSLLIFYQNHFHIMMNKKIIYFCYFLGVFCMPFTLVGTLLRDFVFGELMCKFIPYLQGKRVL